MEISNFLYFLTLPLEFIYNQQSSNFGSDKKSEAIMDHLLGLFAPSSPKPVIEDISSSVERKPENFTDNWRPVSWYFITRPDNIKKLNNKNTSSSSNDLPKTNQLIKQTYYSQPKNLELKSLNQGTKYTYFSKPQYNLIAKTKHKLKRISLAYSPNQIPAN